MKRSDIFMGASFNDLGHSGTAGQWSPSCATAEMPQQLSRGRTTHSNSSNKEVTGLCWPACRKEQTVTMRREMMSTLLRRASQHAPLRHFRQLSIHTASSSFFLDRWEYAVGWYMLWCFFSSTPLVVRGCGDADQLAFFCHWSPQTEQASICVGSLGETVHRPAQPPWDDIFLSGSVCVGATRRVLYPFSQCLSDAIALQSA